MTEDTRPYIDAQLVEHADDAEQVFTDGAVLNSVVKAMGVGEATQTRICDSSSTGIEDLWRYSMVARKAAAVLPTMALSTFKGWTKKNDADQDVEQEAFEWFMSDVYLEVLSAAVKGRVYGDGFALLLFDDGQSLEAPLNLKTITDFYGVIAKSVNQLKPAGAVGDIAKAETYTISLTTGEDAMLKKSHKQTSVSYIIHRSRIIHLPGLIDFSDIKDFYGGYNQSVFYYCQKEINQYEQATKHGVDMLKTHSTYVVGIDGLAVNTRRKAINDVASRLSSIMDTIRLFGGVVVDSKKEQASVINRTYSGVDTLIKQVEQGLTNSIDVPASYIVSSIKNTEVASGDRYTMAELIDNYYMTHLNKVLMRVFECYAAWKKLDYKDYKLSRVSALKLTRSEEADVRFKNAQTDSLYLVPVNAADPDSSVLKPEDIRTRWESSEYSDELTLVPTKASQPTNTKTKTPKEGAGLATVASRMMTGANGRSAYNGQTMQ